MQTTHATSRVPLGALGFLSAHLLVSTASAQGTLVSIGHLTGGNEANAAAVSADGTTVVGTANPPSGVNHAVRWTVATGLQDLGTLFPGFDSSVATGISADGGAIVGYCTPNARAFLWDAFDGMQMLGIIGTRSFANGVSGDGRVIVGWYIATGPSTPSRAVRWTVWGPTDLGALGGNQNSTATAVSGDGSTAVGWSDTNFTGAIEAFRWTGPSGMVSLGRLPGTTNSWALGVNHDGTVIVGHAISPTGVESAFRWTQASGMQSLGTLAGTNILMAYGASSDGNAVVGGSDVDAFLWTPATGIRRFREVLSRDYGVDVRGWCLASATGVSADGRTIVGHGTDPTGGSAGWVATLDAPLDTPLCDADWNRDGFVDPLDYNWFINAFEAGDRTADFNGDCFVDPLDYNGFINAFEAGC